MKERANLCVQFVLTETKKIREKAARKIAQDGADQGTKAAEERDAAVRTVDELRRQIKQREDSYDILVRFFVATRRAGGGA